MNLLSTEESPVFPAGSGAARGAEAEWPPEFPAMAERALSLAERLTRPAAAAAGLDLEEAGRRWARWRDEVAGGSDGLMDRRLDWEGVARESVWLQLADRHSNEAAGDEGGWIHFWTSREPRSVAEPLATAVTAAIGAATALPLAAAYEPLITAVMHDVAPAVAALDHRLDAAALADLAGGLLHDLGRLASRALVAAFDDFRREIGAPADRASTAAHDAFVARFCSLDAWYSVLRTYPVVGRLLAAACASWAVDTRRFLHRLQADWSALAAVVHDDPTRPLPPLRRLHNSLADRHGGACAVRVLEFSPSERLIYKARPLDLEADFHQLLRTLAAHGLVDAPPALRVLPRAGYGWVEFAHAAPVPDRPALEAWFRRAGSLLCVMHLLGANDGHMENIIATVAGPVLIDVETLLQPGRTPGTPNAPIGTFAQATRQIQDSVLQTGLLPFWQSGRQGRPYDIGGFTGTGGYESPVLHHTWEGVGTDAVQPAWRRAIAQPLQNLPVLHGVRHSAGDHLAALTAGFSSTWQFLHDHRAVFADALSGWADAALRVLIRPTTHYAALLEQSLAADALSSGLDRSFRFEALYRPLVRQYAHRPAHWTAVTEEIRALELGDIPIFHVTAGGRDLMAADGRCLVPNAYAESAVAAAQARLDRLTHAEKQRQLELMAAAFIDAASVPTPAPAEPASSSVEIDSLLATTPLARDAGLIATASVIGKQLVQAAIRGPDGFVTWVAPSSLHPGQQAQQGGNYYLYDGSAGIALFLAGLARVTGDPDARATALGALAPIAAILDDPNAANLVRREGIGGCSGLGSLVYVLTTVAALLDRPDLCDRAQRVSALIDDERIATDQAYDVVSGSAGAVLSLLTLHQATGNPDALARAVACGRHLVTRAERVGSDAVAWPSWPDRLLLAGYSHGAAGIVAALAALFRATGDPVFGETARAGIRYERSLFDPSARNWPILLPAGGSRMASTWCHGAPGILLGRAGLLGIFGESEDRLIREEMEAATQATLSAGLSPIDHLCCGTMGRVEILHTVAPILGGKTVDLARLGATLTIQRAQQRGAFALQTDPVRNAVFQPGFFRGLSGIGYACLRLAAPAALPALLAWESTPSTARAQ